jgi:hypothetical protein
MRSDWADGKQGDRFSDLYGPRTPRESGSVDPWHVPRQRARAKSPEWLASLQPAATIVPSGASASAEATS